MSQTAVWGPITSLTISIVTHKVFHVNELGIYAFTVYVPIFAHSSNVPVNALIQKLGTAPFFITFPFMGGWLG